MSEAQKTEIDPHKGLMTPRKEALREWAKERGIECYDCCEFISEFDTEECPTTESPFVKGQWEGLTIQQALRRAKSLDRVFEEHFVVSASQEDGSERSLMDRVGLSKWMWEIARSVRPLGDEDLPYVWYCETGDILNVVLKVCDYYSEWINHTLSIERQLDTHEIRGFEIWGFKGTTEHTLKWVEGFLAKKGLPTSLELSKRIIQEREKVGA